MCVQQLQGPTKLMREDCKDELISFYRALDLKDLASIKISLVFLDSVAKHTKGTNKYK